MEEIDLCLLLGAEFLFMCSLNMAHKMKALMGTSRLPASFITETTE
jgi:hypothetical protein